MSNTSLITGVAHLGIRVFELERSRTFYEKLGFEFVVGPVGPEPVAIMKHSSGVDINFILNARTDTSENILQDVPEKHAGYTHVALTVGDVDEAVAHLDTVGIPIKAGPINYPGGARGIFLRDPDMNTVELYQHAPGAHHEGEHAREPHELDP